MKLANIMEQERQSAYLNRKKILQRKEADDAYRKNAQYFQPKKNPKLLEQDNLLAGRKVEQRLAEPTDVASQVHHSQTSQQNLQQTKNSVEVQKHTLTAVDSNVRKSFSSSQPVTSNMTVDRLSKVANDTNIKSVNMGQNLQQVRNAMLVQAIPPFHDLHVVSRAEAPMQQVLEKNTGAKIDEAEFKPAYVTETMDVNVPERFSKKLTLDPFANTIFGKRYEEVAKERIFTWVSTKYTAHIQMVKNGYSVGHNSTFSMTA